MTHLSLARQGQSLTAIEGAVSDAYRQKVHDFVNKPGRCFGLMTFGNYTGYNWCQRLNNKLLYGQARRQFVYPDEVGRWRNFWTLLGGDPYILDDQLGNTMVDAEDDRFDDLVVWRNPFSEIGHGRTTWFSRDNFVKKLSRQLERHLYS